MATYKIKPLESQVISSATNSDAVLLRYIRNYAVQVVTSAVSTPSGASVKLQASNDQTNWSDLAGTSNNITTTGNVVINADGAGYKYVRAVFAISSGTITSEVIFTGKEHNTN